MYFLARLPKILHLLVKFSQFIFAGVENSQLGSEDLSFLNKRFHLSFQTLNFLFADYWPWVHLELSQKLSWRFEIASWTLGNGDIRKCIHKHIVGLEEGNVGCLLHRDEIDKIRTLVQISCYPSQSNKSIMTNSKLDLHPAPVIWISEFLKLQVELVPKVILNTQKHTLGAKKRFSCLSPHRQNRIAQSMLLLPEPLAPMIEVKSVKGPIVSS